MRVYSNTILSWPQLLHVFQTSRVYPGQWHNFYFYRIKHIQPLTLHTYSPINILQENRQYYCYNKFYQNNYIDIEHTSIITINNMSESDEKLLIYIPKCATINDVIAIRDDSHFKYPYSLPCLL